MKKASQYLSALVIFLAAYLQFNVVAQGTFMVPPGFENTEGDAGQPILFGRQQEVIRLGPAAFPGLPPGGVILNAMSWRLNAGAFGGTFDLGQCEISLSTQPIEVIGDYYRPGSDRIIVFSGALVLSPPTPSSKPTPFNMTIPFAQPFFYKPGTPLLVDMAAGGRSPLMDAVLAPGTDFVYPFGSIPNHGPAWILQFSYGVPEPQAGVLAMLGFLWLKLRRTGGIL